jgi:hypothetical protein
LTLEYEQKRLQAKDFNIQSELEKRRPNEKILVVIKQNNRQLDFTGDQEQESKKLIAYLDAKFHLVIDSEFRTTETEITTLLCSSCKLKWNNTNHLL